MTKRTIKRPPNAYKVISYLASKGLDGVTEMEILDAYRLPNARNYLTDFERQTGIRLGRLRLPTSTGALYTRYSIQNKSDAKKVINHLSAFKVGSHELNEDFILNQYPEAQEVNHG